MFYSKQSRRLTWPQKSERECEGSKLCTPKKPCREFFGCHEFQRCWITRSKSSRLIDSKPTNVVNSKSCRLQRSTIPKGGSGLFNKHLSIFTVKSIITAYGTHFYDSKICRSNNYVFKNLCGCDVQTHPRSSSGNQWFKKYVYGSVANDPMCDECVNAKIVSCPVHEYAAYVVCGKPIPTGNEIFISYGKQFWDALLDPRHPRKGTRLDNVDTTYGGFCDKHANPYFHEEEEELKEIYS